MKKITVCFYQSENNKEPVKEFLKSLHKQDRKIIGVDIKTVEFGWPIGMPVCQPLGKGLYEVRSNLTSKELPELFFVSRNQK